MPEWTEGLDQIQDFREDQFPKTTIVVPTFNCPQLIGITLDSLLSQDYPSLEVIVIDGGSTDRTLEVVKSHGDERVRVYSVTGYNRYEMLNKGITLAHGLYVNFLFPGDYYLYKSALKDMMSLALSEATPDLVYCGSLLRDGRTEVKMLYRQLNLKLLKKGKQPASLQSCWFLTDVFSKIGKFDTELELRGGYDLLCRFVLHGRLRYNSMNRVLTDYDLRWVTRALILTHFKETWKIILKYFGIKTGIAWLFSQKDTRRYVKSLLQSIKKAFFGQ